MQDSPLNDIWIGKISSKWAEHNQIFCKYMPSTTSTNDWAKKLAFEKETLEHQLCLYLTDHQTQGRGRFQREWLDTMQGSSLLSSWSYLTHEPPQPTLSPRIGMSLFRAVRSTWPFLAWNLKAPNDLYIRDKKVAGLLIENIVQGDETRVIIGLGFNVLSKPAEVENSTSLVKALTAKAPLLGEDWIGFLDRWFLELTDALLTASEPLSTTLQHSLVFALNRHPLLPEKYTHVDESGNLKTASKKIAWSEL